MVRSLGEDSGGKVGGCYLGWFLANGYTSQKIVMTSQSGQNLKAWTNIISCFVLLNQNQQNQNKLLDNLGSKSSSLDIWLLQYILYL